MESEQKVSTLLGALDLAMEELDAMEAKLDAYHQYIAVSPSFLPHLTTSFFVYFLTLLKKWRVIEIQ